jgi:hypothetical protein
MVADSKLDYMRRQFKPGEHYIPKEHALSRALSRISADCGLSHISLAEWEAPLRAVVPGSGEKVDLPAALFAERAGGVSLEALTVSLTRDALLATLGALPHAAVRDAALFDALTQQGDRHAENVFIARAGAYFKLIDSRDAALEATGMDSLFLPGTTSFERNRVGNLRIQSPDAVVVRFVSLPRARACACIGARACLRLTRGMRGCPAGHGAAAADGVGLPLPRAGRRHRARLPSQGTPLPQKHTHTHTHKHAGIAR